MTPHHLHALAAAWSLHTARQRLADLAHTEARRNATSLLDAAPILSSATWGVRHGVGGHGDPTCATLTAYRGPVTVTTWADILRRSDDRLRWIAGQLPTPAPIADDGNPLARLLADIPRLLPGTVRVVAQHLRDEDGWLRGPDVLCLPPVRRPLPGVDCPACGTRALEVQTAGPEQAWTVVCATGCRCRGVSDVGGRGCPCGMPGAVEGVAHIWPRAVVLGAVAGAAPTR